VRMVVADGSMLLREGLVRPAADARRADPLAALTPRERDVLRLMAEGHRQLSVLLAENLLPAAADQGQHRHHQGGNGEQ
jgi:hypothetical protein